MKRRRTRARERPTLRDQISASVRKRYPDVYYCAGVGWCGPEYKRAEALDRFLTAATQLGGRR